MNRKTARENAFILLFEKHFNKELSIDEILNTALTVRDFETDEFCELIANGVTDKIEAVDNAFVKFLNGWSVDRISKVSLTVLRIAVYEMLFLDQIPVAVSANEAVEICKKYATEDDSAFVNGVLSSVIKELKSNE